MNGEHEKRHRVIDDRLRILNVELDAVEEELELQAAIVRNLAEGVMLVRIQDGIIVYTNPTMNEIFGYEESELKGKHVSILNSSCSTSKIQEAEKVMEDLKQHTQRIKHKQIMCIKKDGNEFLCQTKISTFKHKTHGDVWVALHATD